MHIQGVTDGTDFWNKFCSNQYSNFFFIYIIRIHSRYTYAVQKITENQKFKI